MMYKRNMTFSLSETLLLIDTIVRHCFSHGQQFSYTIKLFQVEHYSLCIEHQLCLFKQRHYKGIVAGREKGEHFYFSMFWGAAMCSLTQLTCSRNIWDQTLSCY